MSAQMVGLLAEKPKMREDKPKTQNNGLFCGVFRFPQNEPINHPSSSSSLSPSLSISSPLFKETDTFESDFNFSTQHHHDDDDRVGPVQDST